MGITSTATYKRLRTKDIEPRVRDLRADDSDDVEENLRGYSIGS